MIKTISIDFWNTLVVAESGGKKRQQTRLKVLQEAASNYRKEISADDVKQAKEYVSKEFDKIWLGQHRTMVTEELVQLILSHLNINPTSAEKELIIKTFQESLWDGPPDLAPGVLSVVKALSGKYRLAMISDTMFSPGRVLRTYLESKGLLQSFQSFVFSDETGFSKPDKRAFDIVAKQTGAMHIESLHIGDIQETDILGANQSGFKSILYTGLSKKYEKENSADFVCKSWDDIAELLL